MKKKVYSVKSDNFIGLITISAYEAWLVPSMSTGDWSTHTKTIVEVDDSDKEVIDCKWFEDEHDRFEVWKCQECGRG